VQTGFGRTGEMFASSHYEIEPDMLCVAKAMGGGFPIGAVLCSDKISPPTGNHGSTFGGNPLASVAGLETIKYIEEKNCSQNQKKRGNISWKF